MPFVFPTQKNTPPGFAREYRKIFTPRLLLQVVGNTRWGRCGEHVFLWLESCVVRNVVRNAIQCIIPHAYCKHFAQELQVISNDLFQRSDSSN